MFLRQLCCLGKKLEVGCSEDRLIKTVEEYHDIESQTRTPTLGWKFDALDPRNIGTKLHFCDGLVADSTDLFGEDGGKSPLSFNEQARIRRLCQRLQQIADDVSRSFPFFEAVSYSEKTFADGRGISFRHGHGAVADRESKVNKYNFRYWPAKLQEWFPFEQCGKTASDRYRKPLNHEVPSRLIAVPKTAKGPRLIASEPSQHQWCQQAMKDFFVENISRIFKSRFIDFRDQAKSQRMVKAASLTGDLVTVDLSSASDRLSCWAIERMFRRNQSILHSIHSTRTRWMRDDISSPSRFFFSKKFASQGTALTFPVQTLFFLCCTLACLPGNSLKELILRNGTSVQVFGDDIIMPKTGYADLKLLLQYLGLKVNTEKSFSNGFFRESCGADCYKGYDVTPVKPKSFSSDGPASRAALLDFSNNLFVKGYWNASRAAESTHERYRKIIPNLPIVGRESGVIGRRSFCGDDTSHLKSRWNSQLHKTEYRVWGWKSRISLKPINDLSALLQYYCENPRQDLIWSSGVAERPKTSDSLRWADLQS
jgi:predicted SnoaL-like aldol condensation-catalyzing enzyme